MVNKSFFKGEIILIFVAILWGSCFFVQKTGMDYVGPYTLGAFRFTIGALILLPVIAVFSGRDRRIRSKSGQPPYKRCTLWLGGTLCGLALFFAATFQQIGLVYTTAGKAAFLTAMDIVAVEIFGIVVSRKLHLNTLLCVLLAVLGMYLLCIRNGLTLELGDALELVGALFWAAQTLFVDKYAGTAASLKLSFVEFFVVGVLSTAGMLIFERPSLSDIIACAFPILYTAIIEVALCYTLQIIGQRYVPPVIAAVTLSLESVFAVIFAAVFIRESVSPREIGGMAFMLIAVIAIQLPADLFKPLKAAVSPRQSKS